jgi:hypothetical protein
MSRCSQCGSALPGFESLCPKCYEESYSRIVQPKSWREKLSSRLTALNAIYFLGAFAFGFVANRTGFFYIYTTQMAPKTAAVAALLFALFFAVVTPVVKSKR